MGSHKGNKNERPLFTAVKNPWVGEHNKFTAFSLVEKGQRQTGVWLDRASRTLSDRRKTDHLIDCYGFGWYRE